MPGPELHIASFDDSPEVPLDDLNFDPANLVAGEDEFPVQVGDMVAAEKIDSITGEILTKHEGEVTSLPVVGEHNGEQSFLGSIMLKGSEAEDGSSIVIPTGKTHEVYVGYAGGSAREFGARPVHYNIAYTAMRRDISFDAA